MIGDKLNIYTFDYLMSQALNTVPDTMDKRQGSIIFDALAPACQRLAELYGNLIQVYRDTFAETASGEYLDYRVSEQGIHRYAATYAIKKVYIIDTQSNPMSIPIGTRFSTISDTNPITYVVTAVYEENGEGQPGYYQLQCEVAGSIGNEYTGPLTHITNVRGIGSAIMSTLLVPARDEETDDSLRERYFDAVNNKSYGGNLSQYREQVKAIAGVGGVQIYPVWNGGGTVKLSIVDTQKNICSADFLSVVQNEVDPENAQGEKGTGLGLAPIGHKVTVVTPSELEIAVTLTINLGPNISLGQVKTAIKDAISSYIYSLRDAWDEPDSFGNYYLAAYRSRISANVLTIPGVVNVASLTLNGQDEDVVLVQNGTTQELPRVGAVTVNGEVI